MEDKLHICHWLIAQRKEAITFRNEYIITSCFVSWALCLMSIASKTMRYTMRSAEAFICPIVALVPQLFLAEIDAKLNLCEIYNYFVSLSEWQTRFHSYGMWNVNEFIELFLLSLIWLIIWDASGWKVSIALRGSTHVKLSLTACKEQCN